jgi:cobalt-zinc-cadmium efflux system membrane fusion protein
LENLKNIKTVKTNLNTSIFSAIALSGLLALQACGGNNPSAEAKTTQFCIADTIMNDLQIDIVGNERVANELQLTGKVTFNESKVAKVYPLVGGNVEDVKTELGDYVQKGQVLAVIRSSEIAEIEQQLASSQSSLSVAVKNFEIAEDMYKSGLSSEKEVLEARKELQNVRAEIQRLKEVVSIYGISKGSIYTVKAPISGFVVEKNISNEMQLRSDNADNMFTISDLDKVWILANVYESDIARVKEGHDATITTLSYKNKEFKGKIDKVFNVLDPQTKTMKIRIVLDNKDYLLKPEMFANVTVNYDSEEKMLAVPAEALVFDKSKNYVVVYNDACNVENKEVNVYKTLNGVAFLHSGVKPGEKVITRKQLLIYNALNN